MGLAVGVSEEEADGTIEGFKLGTLVVGSGNGTSEGLGEDKGDG